MTVVVRDTFSGGDSGTSSSGSAPFSTTDADTTRAKAIFRGSPTAGDTFDYTLTFPTGTLTLRLVFTSSTSFQFRKISTITGNTFDTLITTITSPTNYPAVGDATNLRFTITRGAVNNSTSFTVSWGKTGSANTTSNTFTTTGEQTPSAGAFVITGTAWQVYNDITGRVPDDLGGGTWGPVVQFNAEDKLAIVSGALVPLYGTYESTLYRVAGSALATADYTVRATYLRQLAAVAFPFAYSYVGARVDQYGNGYWFELADFGDDPGNGFYLTLFAITGSTDTIGTNANFGVIAGPDFYDEALGDGPHTIAIDVDGTTITGNLDSGLHTITMTDATFSGVEGPGIGAYNGDADALEIQFSLFEVEIAGVDLGPCGNLWSAHDFIGTRPDVDGQLTDTYPGQGTWTKHPSATALLANTSLRGTIVGTGRAVYRDQAIPALPPDYCVNVTASYPQAPLVADPGNPGSPVVPRPLIWQDDFDGSGGLDGRTVDGATWSQVYGESSQNGPDAIVDGSMVYLAGSSPPDQATASLFRIDGILLPADYDVEIDVYVQSNEYGVVGVDTRMQAPGSAPSLVEEQSWNYHWSLLQNQDVPYKNLYHAGIGSDPNGGLGTENALGPPGSIVTLETRVRGIGSAPAVIKVYFGGSGPACGPLGIEEITFFDGQFQLPRHNFNAGPPGLLLGTTPEGAASPLRVMAFRIYGVLTGEDPCSPGSPGGVTDIGEVASTELLARYDPTTDTGYVLRQTFDHSLGGAPIGTYALEERSSGTPTLMRSMTVALAHGAAYRLRLQPHGTVLYAEVDGEELWTFDVATDTADETLATVANHTTGEPGLGGTDTSGTGAYLLLKQFRVYAETTVTIPCVGPHPYPPNPPPPPPDPQPIFIYRKTDTVWLPIAAPTAGVPGGIIPVAGTVKQTIGDLRIRDRAAWVALGGDLAQLPPPDGPFPPFPDPCEDLDPDDPDDFPPIGDVSPVPFAGNRFFGLQGYPPTLYNSIFNASQQPAEMLYFMTTLSQAAARSGVIVGAQGGYKKFIVNGAYSQAAMNAFIDSHAPYADQIKAYQDAGTLACIYIADDQRVARLWPPVGLSDTELARIAARWLSVIPGIRLGIRARPRTFAAPIPGLTVYGTQFDGPMQVGKKIGDIVTVDDFRTWRNAECAKVRSWPAGIQIIMGPNALHGGDGESGVQYYTGTGFDGRYMFSAAEWVRAADGWYGDNGGGYDDLIIGLCSYEWLPDLLPHVGLLDAMTLHRNAMMGIPAL